jgi:HNH endonuclease
VYASSLLNLPRGSGWLRVAPMGDSAQERVERVVFALPARTRVPRRLALPPGKTPSAPSADGEQKGTADGQVQAAHDAERTAVLALLSAPDAAGCRRWLGSHDPKDKYPRAWWRGKWRRANRLLYEWARGPIPPRHEVHHACGHRWCMEVEHFEALPKGEHARREAQRRRQDKHKAAEVSATGADEATPAEPAAADTFAIALFAGVDRPAVQPRAVSLDELTQLLGRFEVLADKRQARCWSPTRYADDATSRGNAGVEAVSCLVFDCDRVEPDWARLEGYWYLAHTTYQHTPEHPRWRLVLPLVMHVPAQQWSPTWRRAHAALCPEADPVCKDPSRQYYLPSHPPGVAAEARCQQGLLLDPATLPELPPEPEPLRVRHLAPPAVLREPTTHERRRGEAYLTRLIDELARVPAGGRNAALNKTAWKLGQWVAAGALDQGEVEDALYGAAERNGVVADDGARQCWATIRSGLSAGLQQPIDLDAEDRVPQRRKRS